MARTRAPQPGALPRGMRIVTVEIAPGVVAHAVQLAIAPVFLLTGLAGLLAVMANRLARVIDRARWLAEHWPQMSDAARTDGRAELVVLERRRRLASWSINLCTGAALLVCVVIVALFVEEFVGGQVRAIVAALFMLTMLLRDRRARRVPARGVHRHALDGDRRVDAGPGTAASLGERQQPQAEPPRRARRGVVRQSDCLGLQHDGVDVAPLVASPRQLAFDGDKPHNPTACAPAGRTTTLLNETIWRVFGAALRSQAPHRRPRRRQWDPLPSGSRCRCSRSDGAARRHVLPSRLVGHHHDGAREAGSVTSTVGPMNASNVETLPPLPPAPRGRLEIEVGRAEVAHHVDRHVCAGAAHLHADLVVRGVHETRRPTTT